MRALQAFRCLYCSQDAVTRREICPRCGAFDAFVEPPPRPRGRGPEHAALIRTRRFRRAPLGLAPLDHALGGGIVPGSILLLWGPPGSRKTTRIARGADHAAAALGSSALYLSSEAPGDLVAYLARTEGHPPLGQSWIWHEPDLVTAAREAKLRRGAGVVVFDSIQAFIWRREMGSRASISALLREASDLARAGAAVILVSQVNADGEPAGPNMSLHMVDVCVRMNLLGGTVTKNRYHPAPAAFTF